MAQNDITSKALISSGDERRYAVGDAVRVRAGVIDPDFPDFPMSGWAGVVADIEDSDPPLYLIRWTRETLAQLAPVYRVRCDRAGLDPTVTSLLGADLEPDTGGPLDIAQPTKLRPPPLDRDDPQDRVRGIFKLTSDDPLPPVDTASLRRFHEHFRKKLKLPTGAFCDGAPLAHEPVRILRLVPFEQTGPEQGLLVEVEQDDKIAIGPLYDISLLSRNAIANDIEAYSEWFFEEPGEDEDEEESANHPIVFVGEGRPAMRHNREGEDFAESALRHEFRASAPFFARIIFACILAGALVGALLWVHDWAIVMAEWGAVFLGCVGGVGILRHVYVTRYEGNGTITGILAALLVALMGALLGGAVGVLLLSYVGAIPGALAGTVFGMVLTACGVRNHNPFLLAVLGSYIGGVVYVFLLDAREAVAGALWGAAGGFAGLLFCFIGASVAMVRIGGPSGK